MQCPLCQHDNPAGACFCNDCGAKLEATCPRCGQANPPGSRFCNGCGERLDRVAAPTATTPPANGFTSPESYTPQHLAERIISSRGALEGERKQVTVLFADLKGSMELLADRDPEEARRILDPVLERMMEAVHRYEGTVNQVMGDGIMALFGAPIAHEDHAVRACYAALRMQEAVKQYAQELQRTQGAFIQIRVGLNSGEVVVRSIGSDLRMDYSAVGLTAHLAARMEQLAAPGSILLAPDTLRLTEGHVRVKPLGPMQIRGLGEPVAVYDLAGAGTARSRLQATAARGLTKFVGRDVELEALRQSVARAGGGQGQAVALVGEPGVGKSRLVWELTHSHRTQGWSVLESGSVSYGKATSYLPVIELLRGYFRIDTADDHRRIRQKVLGRVLDLDEALRDYVPALLALFDVPVEDAQWQALDPAQRPQRTFEAVRCLLLRESQEQPLLMVFEDLHWIDAESQAVLDSLVQSLPAARILLLVNYRPEYEHAWHRKTYYRELRLDPLPAESADALLDALLGDDAGLQSLKRLLVERTGGNPFFLEECVQGLVEIGGLVGDRGAYRLVQPLGATQVPATVQAVLAARIDRLAPEDKRLLQSAAVIGKDVPYGLLAAVAEQTGALLRVGLGRLQATELLYEVSLFPESEYTFKHALTHEVAYGSLLHERRRELHGQIVEAIEQLYADHLMEQSERLAHHALRGEVWAKAVGYLAQAGEKAGPRGAPGEAVAYYEQALDALGHLPETHETVEQAVDLRLALRQELFSMKQGNRALAVLREAEGLAARLADQRRLGWIAAYQAHMYMTAGDPARAVELSERARAMGEALGERALEVEASMYAGGAHRDLGNYTQAIDCLRWTVTQLTETLDLPPFARSHVGTLTVWTWLATSLAHQGKFDDAIRACEAALQLAERNGSRPNLLHSQLGLARVYLLQGKFARAIPGLDRVLKSLAPGGGGPLVDLVPAAMGYALARSGQPEEGLAYLEPATRGASAGRLAIDGPLQLAWLGEAYLLAGRSQEAAAAGRRAVARAQEQGARGLEAYGLQLLGDIVAQDGQPAAEQAGAYYRQALARAEELGMRPLAAHCHLGLATLYQKVGRDGGALAELATAAEMYRAMEMPFWLVKAEAALAGATLT
jgi:class 3 adenylate cyclase/tetratricopeptide (TPR) repeat protein